MPSPGNVVLQDKQRRGTTQSGSAAAVSQGKKAGRRMRRGIPLDMGDAGGSYLSPTRLLSSFSNMGISKYREYVPNSDTPGGPRVGVKEEGGRASWQRCDLGDGLGRRPLLVVTSPRNAIQVFSLAHSVIPDDPHVQEVHPAPEEVFCITKLRDDPHCTPAPSGSTSRMEDRRVICAKLVDRGPLCTPNGPIALLIVAGRKGRGSSCALSLEVLDLRTAMIVKKVDLGTGSHANLGFSSRAIVVSIVHSTASLMVLDPKTLEPMCPTIEQLPVDPRSSLPVFALSGRLLAYATSDSPLRPGPDGLGSLVTARTLRTHTRAHSESTHRPPHTAQAESLASQGNNQNVILNSAVEIGGGVARGVWAGLKMGAQAAGRAANQRLASSAPARGSLEIEEEVGSLGSPDSHENMTSESRSLDESSVSVLDESPTIEPDLGGQWIKIIDLSSASSPPRTIAHFRLPRSRQVSPPINGKHTSTGSLSQSRTISHLAFSPDGTAIFAAPADGRTFHLFDIHPAGPNQSVLSGEVAGEVWHTYEMRRGNTAAAVSEVQWSADGRWIGVATQRGTVHVIAVNPSGGPTSAATHVPVKLPNPTQLHPLSTIITPSARVRLRKQPNQLDSDSIQANLTAKFAFLDYRSHPLRPGVSCLDMALYRPTIGQMDLARVAVRGVQPATEVARQADLTKRASALTEMMKTRVGMAISDLEVKSTVMMTWQMPLGPDETFGDGDLSLPSVTKPACAQTVSPKSGKGRRAEIEIQTFTHNPRLLPSTIYLSHQVDFYDARPIDDYSRMSIMDREARTRRLHFRPEVEIHSSLGDPDVKSFDEPLTSALHTVIESSPSAQLPGLPNGHGGNVRQWKASIPIRQVKEGALHLRREYVNRRSTRRRSINTNALSFEEDTVFPTVAADEDSNSSPLSSGVPNTDVGADDVDVDDHDWSVKWEDEYERAVQDDGGPDDLVLGLMDEQEEERKRWVVRQKRLAEQYAKR